MRILLKAVKCASIRSHFSILTSQFQRRLQSFREFLTLTLVAALPLHAFFVTVATKLIAGPDHAPLSPLALWKEGVLGVILVVAFVEWATNGEMRNENGKWRKKFDVIDALILLLIALGISVSFLISDFSFPHVIFGFRYDFVPLVAFFVLRRLPWSDGFFGRLQTTLIVVGTAVAAYGIVTFFLPIEFFRALGYSAMHSLYFADGPIAAFQMIGGTDLHRIQSTMSGPNQLGLWLLLPLAATIISLRRSRLTAHGPQLKILSLLILIAALGLTFSRAAWIGTFIMIAAASWPLVRRLRKRVIVMIGILIIGAGVFAALRFPDQIIRISSTRGHIENPLEAVQEMIAHPFGKGLGTAGPASNRTSETCVILRSFDDPTWWRENMPDMCVFVGKSQIQPQGRDCTCPFLPENWYLQIGVEMGWLGLALYLWMTGIVLHALFHANEDSAHEATADSTFIAMLGLCAAAMFLHAFEDSAAAYTLWIAAASVLPVAMPRKHPTVEMR